MPSNAAKQDGCSVLDNGIAGTLRVLPKLTKSSSRLSLKTPGTKASVVLSSVGSSASDSACASNGVPSQKKGSPLLLIQPPYKIAGPVSKVLLSSALSISFTSVEQRIHIQSETMREATKAETLMECSRRQLLAPPQAAVSRNPVTKGTVAAHRWKRLFRKDLLIPKPMSVAIGLSAPKEATSTPLARSTSVCETGLAQPFIPLGSPEPMSCPPETNSSALPRQMGRINLVQKAEALRDAKVASARTLRASTPRKSAASTCERPSDNPAKLNESVISVKTTLAEEVGSPDVALTKAGKPRH
ncbi:hypothetical protein EJ08DRAFT_726287 [Tothia fuscella]|uniref:Uncharacterized protein n=1 Tax=Tothia fuscella TaxID=1048955 RepID=A0A9P4NHS6_9PEZI|nr:hypothetical protein EJ08DRAFT_726287 [Tothia fuscella]